MSKPTKFENNRFVGDKRSLVVHDLDQYGKDDTVTAAVDELMASERFLAFGPDTIAEARNRGYHPSKRLRLTLEAGEG